ncbi:MAG TPA: hypothetical protein VKX39_02555 [Bryobacteraceae bacterium]|jgi:hypothetical protein|nr:hypothetical protein [Bryobacteraceae bacterium]
MSWSDDIRCLYCDGRLPLYRKITNGQFCSAAHRKAYWQEQERLAVERLHQTHDTLRAFRPAPGLRVEAIIGAVPEAEAEPRRQLPDGRPWWMPLVNRGEVPIAGLLADPASARSRWPQDGLAEGQPEPLEYDQPLRRPFHVYQILERGVPFAPATAPEIAAARLREPMRAALVPVEVVLHPIARLSAGLQPVFEPIEIIEEEIPPFAGLVPLAPPSWREMAKGVAGAGPIELALRSRLPLDRVEFRVGLAPAKLLAAGLRQLPMDHAPRVQGVLIDHLRALDLGAETGAPLFTLATPLARPRLRLAPGRRYPVQKSEGAAQAIAPQLQNFANAPAISLPWRTAQPPAPPPRALEEPQPAGLLALKHAAPPKLGSFEIHPAPEAMANPGTPRPAPILPRARFDAQRVAFELSGQAVSEACEAKRPEFFTHAVDFWNRVPRDFKLLAFTIPLLLALALHPELPKVHVATPSKAARFQRDFQKAWNEELVNVKQSLTERAAIALDEDFRAGLDDWVSRGDAPTEWSFDATGFVRPGPLALYRPSMQLNDYQMQFLGMIDQKALSWVARAADFNNLYVMKLVVLKPGPLPTIGLTRYAVIDGKAVSRVDTAVPVDAREDMLYRVRLDVHGDDFALSVQGQLIDAWSEPRLNHGGVGFFTARGESSRLRWVQVTHQYDMLGRLCAYLAPTNTTQATSGGWEQ